MVKSIRCKDLDFKVNGSIDSLLSVLNANNKLFVSFVNPFSYECIAKNKEVVDSIDVFYSDGILLSKLLSFCYKRKIDRVSFDFSSIADPVFCHLAEKKLKIAIVGSKKEEIDIFVGKISSMYPDLDVVFYRDGYFEEGNYNQVANDILSKDPDFILLGLGSPKQEVFGAFLKERSKSKVKIFTCGGFIYQTSIKDDYYYPIVKKMNLMWLQRFIMHDYVRKRILKDYPRFIVSYIYGYMKGK